MPNNPQLIVIEVMPVANGNSPTLALTLACVTPNVVDAGKVNLKHLGKPMYFLLKLVSASGFRFPSNPADAAWFAPGNSPPGPGNAGGRFDPEAVSDDGDVLLVHVRGGNPGTFSALLHFEAATAAPAPTWQTAGTTMMAAAVRSGGPIIIND